MAKTPMATTKVTPEQAAAAEAARVEAERAADEARFTANLHVALSAPNGGNPDAPGIVAAREHIHAVRSLFHPHTDPFSISREQVIAARRAIGA